MCDEVRRELPPLGELVRFAPHPRERCVICSQIADDGIDFGSDEYPAANTDRPDALADRLGV